MRRRLADLAALVGGQVKGDGELAIEGVATLAESGPASLSFLTNPRYRAQAEASRAGAVLVGPGVEIAGHSLLVAAEPYLALARILEEFHPAPAVEPGVHPTAMVAASARVDPGAQLAAHVVVGERSRIAAGVVVGAGCVVGRDCSIGAGSVLHPRVVLYDRTEVGQRCVLHAGVVLGSDGFGFATDAGRHRKIPQVGRVVIEDEVEIGANSTVDRATLDETRIGAGSKLDNLVQVGHNVRIGRGCILVSQSGIAGSTELGDYVVLAGQSGIAGHLKVGDGVRVAAKSAVFQNVEAGQQVAGTPAVAAGKWRRQQALLGRLEEIHRRLLNLEARLGGRAKEEEG
ncbi:MAG: UDP-3-O-(3-hydroxymyristoyl)glucosamine N-acyltransferase [Acidobacteriota bacterium]